jgi:alkylation response protein AidB-like acyl-CoA dehydrogenase
MQFAFTEEQLMFQRSVRDMLASRCSPEQVRAAWSHESGRIDGLWQQLAELGLTGMLVPEAYGGLAMAACDWVLVLEQSGVAALPEPLTESSVVAAPLLAAIADAETKQRHLPAVASGEVSLGVRLASQNTVLAADSALLFLLEHDAGVYLLARDACQLHAERSVDHSRHLFRVSFDAAAHDPLVRASDVRSQLDAAFDRGALASAAQIVGLSRHLIDTTVAYCLDRTQFGRPIGSFQALKHKLADVRLKLEFTQPLVYRAAHSIDIDSPHRALHVSLAKAYASELAHLASGVALQCHGAIGYSFECDLHLWMKRAWALASSWGTAEHHMQRIEQAVLDGPVEDEATL